MEFLVANNLDKYFPNVLMLYYFRQWIVNQDMILMYDTNDVLLQIHIQILARKIKKRID
jgi:hypothetical protein